MSRLRRLSWLPFVVLLSAAGCSGGSGLDGEVLGTDPAILIPASAEAMGEVESVRFRVVRSGAPVFIDEEVQIDTEVVFDQDLLVPINETLPIKESFDTRIEVETPLGFSVPLDVTVPVDIDVPIDLELDVVVNETVPISATVPVKLDFPIAIDVGDTELAALAAALAEGLRSLEGVLAGLGGG